MVSVYVGSSDGLGSCDGLGTRNGFRSVVPSPPHLPVHGSPPRARHEVGTPAYLNANSIASAPSDRIVGTGDSEGVARVISL